MVYGFDEYKSFEAGNGLHFVYHHRFRAGLAD